jgi:hypothetical protein
MGADFDGDQVAIVSLEREASLAEAEGLLPGAYELRFDRFRRESPMFSIAGELADLNEDHKVQKVYSHLDQVAWCEVCQAAERARIERTGRGLELLSRAVRVPT